MSLEYAKKIIEYGWDAPSTRFVRRWAREMERVPFDGLVIRVTERSERDDEGSAVSRRTFAPERLPGDALEAALDDLANTDFDCFTENLLQMVSSPVIDWFDSRWEICVENAARLARVAKAAGLRGIMLDLEDYASSGLWSYAAIAQRGGEKSRSREEYVEQIGLRGRQFMSAVAREFQDVRMLCLLGPSFSWVEELHSLLFAFYDGMMEAATPGVLLADGAEQAYGRKDRDSFQAARRQVLETSREHSRDAELFRTHIRAAPAVWLDYWSHEKPWRTDEFSQNHYTPTEFGACLAYALEAADDWTWIYSQRLSWWDGTMPNEYVEALRRAKEGPG